MRGGELNQARYRYRHWLPRILNVNAITLKPYVLFYNEARLVGRDTVLHEECHLYQQASMGLFRFLWRYAKEFLSLYFVYWSVGRVYREHSFEKEARSYAGKHIK